MPSASSGPLAPPVAATAGLATAGLKTDGEELRWAGDGAGGAGFDAGLDADGAHARGGRDTRRAACILVHTRVAVIVFAVAALCLGDHAVVASVAGRG